MAKSKLITHHRTCNLCEAMCGIEIQAEDDHVVSIKGDKQDPFSRGEICPKAVALKDLQEDPDRLKSPLLKTASGWQEISWNKAFDIAAEKIRGIQKKHGNNAVGAYLGNPNVHNYGNMLFAGPFLHALRTRNKFSATSNDQLPHMRVSLALLGHQLLFPVPDIDHTDLFILMGSNPAASNGSLMTAPGYTRRLKELKKRGGQFFLIDPRRTETARYADEHMFIKPGTDALFLLGVLHALFAEGLMDAGRVGSFTDDIAQIQILCADFSPEVVAPVCGIEATKIRELTRLLATTPRACLFSRMGTSTQSLGTITTWLMYVVNILSGHMDERGGLMFTKPAADMVEVGALMGQQGHYGKFKSRVSGLDEFGGELPASVMAEEILTEGKGQIKAMVTMAGNPVLSSPNGRQLEKALESLDFMVSIDFYLNETTCHADLILPPTPPLERPHFDLIFNTLAVRNVAKYSPALFKKSRQSRHDWQILSELTRRLTRKGLSGRLKSEAAYRISQQLGADGMLDLILRLGPYGTQLPGTSRLGTILIDALQDMVKPSRPIRRILDMGPYGAANRTLTKGMCVSTLKNYPHGIDLGPLQSCLPERLYRKHKRIKLAPPDFLRDISRVRKLLDYSANAPVEEQQLLLIGRRHVRSNNSWLHNSYRLVKGKNRCTLMIHPEDADAIGIKHNQKVRVESRVGAVEIAAEVTEDIMPGVVSIPHGWGHHRSHSRLQVANKYAGVSLNDLVDEKQIDKLSGTSVLNGIPVQVTAINAAVKGAAKTKDKTKLKKEANTKPGKKRVRVSAKLS